MASRSRSSPSLSGEPEGDRAMIGQADKHLSAEFTCCYRRVGVLRGGKQVLEQVLGFVWRLGGGKARAGPFAGIGCQGELGYQQQAAPHVGQRAVHASCLVSEYTVSEHSFQKAVRIAGGVILLNSDEGEQAWADSASFPLGYRHARLRHALNQGNQDFRFSVGWPRPAIHMGRPAADFQCCAASG